MYRVWGLGIGGFYHKGGWGLAQDSTKTVKFSETSQIPKTMPLTAKIRRTNG